MNFYLYLLCVGHLLILTLLLTIANTWYVYLLVNNRGAFDLFAKRYTHIITEIRNVSFKKGKSLHCVCMCALMFVPSALILVSCVCACVCVVPSTHSLLLIHEGCKNWRQCAGLHC